MSDHEPRRSVRSTKGQHKSLDQLDQPTADTKKRGRKAGKKSDDKQGSAEEEIIRCVCGATEQDGDPGEPWIACDRCTVWQHNVCMGMSIYGEDVDTEDYWCEKCKPENHKELLEGIARGEKPWEERRRIYEEEKASGKKKGKGGRKAKPKRNSDAREGSAKPSPTPEARGRDAKGPAGTKRKTRADSEGQDEKESHKRRLSESEDLPEYNPPADLPGHISELPDARQTPAKGLSRAISDVLGTLQKKGEYIPKEGESVESAAERFALQIERAVHDAPNHKEYGAQIRTLRFNLKENHELCIRLLHGTLIPPMLATMSSDDLASRELQQKTAKMKAQAERQSILGTEDTAPRLRRTHKGEELVERDNSNVASEDKPSQLRRQSIRETRNAKSPAPEQRQQARRAGADSVSNGAGRRQPSSAKGGNLHLDTKEDVAPRSSDFDLKRVFSSVRSPTSPAHQRRSSQPQLPDNGPGVDADVDRLLQDEDDDREESPPYSPTEETSDPDIVWRGNVSMNTVADFQATARHVGGVNLQSTIGLPWTTLVPKKLTVAGRIDEQIATEYLCSLRYSAPTDITVASLSPTTDAASASFLALIDYFTQRKRYGVVGEKGVGNVRDTYLVPLAAGTSSHPEFMLNLEDNFIPLSRAAPMLLLVVVYRNDAAAMEKLHGPNWAGENLNSSQLAAGQGIPSPALVGAMVASRNASISAPAFSPTSPQVPPTPQLPAATISPSSNAQPQAFPPPQPTPPAQRQPPQPPQAAVGQQLPPGAVPNAQALAQQHQQHQLALAAATATSREQAQRDGEAVAREILGPLATCSAAGFLMTQAAKMQRTEWMLVRTVFEQQPQTRDDLQLLREELERYNQQRTTTATTPASSTALATKPTPTPTPPQATPPQHTPQTPVPIPRVPPVTASAMAPRQAQPGLQQSPNQPAAGAPLS